MSNGCLFSLVAVLRKPIALCTEALHDCVTIRDRAKYLLPVAIFCIVTDLPVLRGRHNLFPLFPLHGVGKIISFGVKTCTTSMCSRCWYYLVLHYGRPHYSAHFFFVKQTKTVQYSAPIYIKGIISATEAIAL